MPNTHVNTAAKRWLCALGMALSLAAYGDYPLGISQEEWRSLSPALQQSIREEQANLRRDLAETDRGRLQCVIEGDAYIAGEWRRMDTIVFDAKEGQSAQVPMFTLDRRYQSDGSVGFNGHRVAFCDRMHGLQRNPERCATLSGTSLQFSRGVRTRIYAERFIRGVMACSYPFAH